jgi:hypothetical protein
MSHLDDCVAKYRNARVVADKARERYDMFLATEPIGLADPPAIDFAELVEAGDELVDAESQERTARDELLAARQTPR